jgi:RimJ/RimL family protein N-acetyltransferase
VLIGQKVVLRDKRIGDAATDYAWRCDSDLCRLDAVPTLDMPYPEYLGYYADELHYPSGRRRKYAIDSIQDGKHIGNCMYYDIDWDKRQAELGIMIGDRQYWGKGYGADAVTTLVSQIFVDTKIDRIYLKTLEWNIRAQRCFQKCGFIACGRTTRQGQDYLVMELHRVWMKPEGNDAMAKQRGVKTKTSLPHAT